MNTHWKICGVWNNWIGQILNYENVISPINPKVSSFEVFSGGFILQCRQSIALEKLLEKKIEQIHYQEENDDESSCVMTS